GDWSSDVCSSDLAVGEKGIAGCGKQSDSGEHQILAKGHALDLDRLRRHCSICLFAPFLDPLVPHGAHFKEGLCFFIEPLAFPAIEDRFPQDAERSLRPEIILVVKAVYGVENLVRWQPRILNVR